jgi:MFS transporter, SP family, sugar:H+ symporter
VCGELFPLKTRARSLSMTTATNWLFNWAIAYSTPYLVNYGPGSANLQSKIFFVWFGCCFICIAFVWSFIYETKNLTLEEVDELYDEVKQARKSKHWKPSTTYKQRASVADQGGQGARHRLNSATTNATEAPLVDANHDEKRTEQV